MTRIFLGLLSILCTLTLHAQQDNKMRSLDSLFSLNNNDTSPGVSIIVIKKGKVICQRNYGLANIQHKVPVTGSTVFDMASVSKQFAAFAIAHLVQQGKLSVQDDIRKYIPEMHDFGKKITIEHLLHHTSGLRDWPVSLALGGQNMHNISYAQILEFAFKQQELNFDPGSEYSYSNTGYSLLAEIVQRVTKQTFRRWCDSVVFKPLGMNNTLVYDHTREVIPHVAYGYYEEGGKIFTSNSELTGLGSSSVFSSVNDMTKWMIEMDNPRREWKPIFTQMFERGKLNNDSTISYAWGLNNSTYRGIKEIDHSGSWGAFGSFMIYFPDQHLSVLLLQNCYDNPVKKARMVADLFLENAEPLKVNAVPGFVSLPPAALDNFSGKYRLGPGWYVTIARKDSQLMAQAVNEDAVAFMPTSDSTFWAYDQPFTFYKSKSGTIEGFIYRGMTCPRVEEKTTTFGDFTGEYESAEYPGTYKVTLENDTLFATHPRNGKIKLVHACNDDFIGEWYMGSVEFYRNEKGKVEGFKATSNRSRKQRFVRLKD